MYRQNFPGDPGMHNMPTQGGTTRVHYRQNPNFFQRVGASLYGILIGIALIVIASIILFTNEGRAVQTAKSLDEGLQAVVHLPTTEVAFEHNNGKLVHLSGELRTDRVLADEMYGVAVNAVKLRRKVEMYQWIEHEHRKEYNEGDRTRVETSYSYSTDWRSHVVDSRSFNNPSKSNPGSFEVESKDYEAASVQVGNFYLSKGLIGHISHFHQIDAKVLPKNVKVQIFNGKFYHTKDPVKPQVGDLRVTFEYAGVSGQQGSVLGSADKVSIVAKQAGAHLTKYETDAGNDLEILYEGELSAQEIFEKEKASNVMLTWILRMAGWFLMFIGFGFATSIVTTLVDWLPIVRELVAMGVYALNMTLSISFSLTIIALGWIRYRPLLGMAILVCACTPFIISKVKARSATHRKDKY